MTAPADELAAAWMRWAAGPGSRDRVVGLEAPLSAVATLYGCTVSQLIDRIGEGCQNGMTVKQAVDAARAG